jgi:crossover junction endodeoxyribonuclease RuvC
MQKNKIILGIDPGTSIMGYGLILVKNNQANMITMGVLELKKYKDHFVKLEKIYHRTLQLIEEYHPQEFAIESQFFGKNIQSMLKLGRGQGVAIAAALSKNLPVFEYSPRKIKLAITGNGNASKEQVSAFIMGLLKIREAPLFFDATDGLAVAVCHSFQKEVPAEGPSIKSWKDFIAKNPNRLKK